MGDKAFFDAIGKRMSREELERFYVDHQYAGSRTLQHFAALWWFATALSKCLTYDGAHRRYYIDERAAAMHTGPEGMVLDKQLHRMVHEK